MATHGSMGESHSQRQSGLPSSREGSEYGYVDEIDETLVGPVYLRLDDPSFRSYVQYANQTYELEEEVGDDEIGLDLSAPPPESWFHGRISRQTAVTRLQDLQGEQGVYLVRESETQPGDYAISYLSRTGYVHHFKINSNCGDYFIGGRQFMSLSELIGFYSNCSCILENESLEVPVVPPRPIPLYMMLRATTPHVKNPGTDELTIDAWEVFILLSRLNDDWGWGRSQRSGESGLIPLMIMEDVSDEDPNLGKEWFHGSISREEVLDLLTHKGEVGSFLVRLSSVDQSERHYSLSVKTPEKVQRFRITRYVTGYYIFGGRPFSSMDDVVDRYRSEVIIDGITLGTPIIRTTMPSDSYAMAVSSPRDRTNSIVLTQAHRQGEKTGLLLLRKGKKSPVYGKWKEFYFVIKYGDQQLLYFERENSHKAEGLLDLKQCQAFAVDPTLYGRNDCLMVMLKYLNELSFYYLVAGTQENAQVWLRVLKRYTLKTHDVSKSEVQQIRSLSLSVRDSKLAKPGAHASVYCLVSLDGAALAKTILMQVPCIFDESYEFQDLPLSTSSFSVEMISASKRFKDTSIGRVTIQLSDMPNGQDDDKWHHLITKTSRTAQGSLRLVANFKHEIIFRIDEYASLRELLLSDDVTVIEALARVCKDHHADLACVLIRIFCQYNRVLPIVNSCLAKSIDKEDNVSTLFRASTLATMLMDQLMKLTAMDYLHSVLKTTVQKIAELKDSCELDPSKLPRGTDLTPHLHQMELQLQNLLVSIFTSVEDCPLHLRYIFHCLQDKVVQKWPTDETVRTRAVSGFLFLRLICPALINPLHFNLLSSNPSESSSRSLKLVAKAVQNLANLVEFKSKEPFMTSLNPFIKRHMPDMIKFIDKLSNVSTADDHGILISPEPARDLATVHHLCSTYRMGLEKLVEKQPQFSDQVTHLGHLLTYNLDDRPDIIRVVKDINCKANSLLCTFSSTDPFVKCYLMKSYCLSLYGCVLWMLHSPALKTIEVALNKILRKVWNLPRQSHTSVVHCVAQVSTISNLLIKRICSLFTRAISSSSCLVRTIFYESSQLMYSFTGYNHMCGHNHFRIFSDHDFNVASIIRNIRYIHGLYSLQEVYIKELANNIFDTGHNNERVNNEY